MSDYLFIGAHPDDIEIGAGGTAARLSQASHRVFFCILTEEAAKATALQRRQEAVKAAQVLGVSSERVLFLGRRDGTLSANSASVTALRRLLAKHGVSPSAVFCHTSEDSHNDHRAAAELVLSTFRETPLLRYGIPNSLIDTGFRPRFFFDISDSVQKKLEALAQHATQDNLDRIRWNDIKLAEAALGTRIGVKAAEGFEIVLPRGADKRLPEILAMNDCPFHKLWYPLIGDRRLIVIHAVPVARSKKEFHWPVDRDRDGLSALNRSFQEVWFGKNPLDQYSCGTQTVEQFLSTDNIMLSGGAVSNPITRTYFNHFPKLRYVIEYDMPDYRRIRIYDRSRKVDILADYTTDNMGTFVLVDYGILTIMKNPLADDRFLIGCMGIHGFGSYGCFKVLSDSMLLRQLLNVTRQGDFSGQSGYQVLVRYNVRPDEAVIVEDSLHRF